MMGQQMIVTGIQLAPVPSQIPAGTPPGLEYLIATDRIMIQQQVEMLELFTGINTNNRYNLMDGMGRRMYFAAENSSACGILCCGENRSWIIDIFDSFGRPVLQGNREGGCGCASNSVQVVTYTGILVGGIVQNCEATSTTWDITDAAGSTVFRLLSPSCSACCPGCATCCEAEFPLIDIRSGEPIGGVTKFYGGFIREAFTAADSFGVTFPVNLETEFKAILIFAAFLIDFMYYESQSKR